MYNLNHEIKKIIDYAKTLQIKKEEYFMHNIRLFLFLVLLLSLHIIFSFLVIYLPLQIAIPIILLNGYIIYFYLTITVHEGTHELIFFFNNKKRYRLIKNLVPLFPLLAGFPGFTIYRKDHFLHHAFTSEEKDPQNSSFINFRKIAFHYFMKNGKMISIKNFFEGLNPILFFSFLSIKILHLVILFILGGWIGIIFGFVMPLLLAALLNAIRVSFRHYKLYPNPKPLRSRSYTFLGSSILGPLGLRYHFEHHLYPFVPSYRLYKLYDFVERKCPKEMTKIVHYKKFYWKDFW